MEYFTFTLRVGMMALSLLLAAQQAHSLECYSCSVTVSEKDRPVDEPCAADPMTGGVGTVTCNEMAGQNACLRLITYYTPLRDSKPQLVTTVYSRLCARKNNETCWIQHGGQSRQEYCYCHGDLCNDAHVIQTSLAGLVICSLIGVFHIVGQKC